MNFRSPKSSFVYLVLLTVILTFKCTSGQSTEEDVKKLATSINIFALNLHGILSAESQENVFFSPLSLSTVLGMIYFGIRGESAEELRQALGYADAGLPDEAIPLAFHQLLEQMSKDTNGYTFMTSNAILIDHQLSLSPEYERGVRQDFFSKLTKVDFAKNGRKVVEDVNRSVERKTRGMIRQVLEDVSSNSAMIIVNAVYFKGKWITEFNPRETKMEDFYNGGTESNQVSMMKHISARFPYTSTDDYQAVTLPYVGDHLSMLILLPRQRDGLPSLEQTLTSTTLEQIRKRLSRRELEVHLPKFEMEFGKNLPPELQRLGIDKIFEGGTEDFSGISENDSERLSVTDVIHKAKIDVNEEGTEAAASTVSNIKFVSLLPQEKPVFRADHPFVFFILDRRNGLILFMGRVSEL